MQAVEGPRGLFEEAFDCIIEQEGFAVLVVVEIGGSPLHLFGQGGDFVFWQLPAVLHELLG